MVKYLMTALAMVAPFTPLHQVYDDFTTFETASYFNDAFGDLDGYVLGEATFHSGVQFEIDYSEETFIYYAFPIQYDIIDNYLDLYYANDYFNFYLNENVNTGHENIIYPKIINYIGQEESFYFGRLNSEAMTIYIENEKGKDVVSDVIGTISSMVIGLLGGLGTGIVGMFNSLFLDGSNISSLGIWIIVLLGLSIALGAVAWVSTLIRGKQR